ncbi:microsomal glutathione S-transferase 1-like [Amphiura filiformis]|uniref:microsomal glutathione S-transferase 1-like n=1 Tax=Amphiura filiformis TaxID=82378 RepID=UPI003B20CC60
MTETAVQFDHEVFHVYATYAVIVLLKMMSMSLLTSSARMKKKSYAALEDYDLYGEKKPARGIPEYDPDVERIRKCHRNDLENIPPFLIIGLLYIFTHPTLYVATMHYRAFVICRFFHMVSYLMPLPQPCRGIGWMVGVAVTVSMGLQILLSIGTF